MASATWTWDLCDNNGATLTELTTAGGKNIAFARNHFAQAEFTLSHGDEAASLLLDSLANDGIPQLRCYRRGSAESSAVLRFAGHLAPFEEAAEEQSTLTATFRSPFARLLGDTTGEGRFTGASVSFLASDTNPASPTYGDAGGIAKRLIDVANGEDDTGLAVGTIEATKQRDRTYTYANIGESIINLTNVLDGFDFDETFVGLGATLAQFNVYAQQGSTRPDARFEYGPDTLRNVRSLTRATRGPINYARVLGANGLEAVATNAASIVKYGLRQVQQTLSDVSEQATLDDRALALLRPEPIKAVTFVPDFALDGCPRPFDDWWIGDSVSLYARRDALVEDVTVRINGARIVIDDEGAESVEVQDPRTADEEATIRSSVSVEIV